MAITKIDITMLEDVGGANNLVKLDSNAKIPAGPAGGLSVKPGPLTSTSDPAIDSNKALGTTWLNSTSGEMYICTDATTGANVWTNVGAGSGNVKPWEFGGSTYGFAVAGYNPPNYPGDLSISKFSFTTDGNAVDWGDLAGTTTYMKSGHSDKDNGYGYSCGGTGNRGANEIARFSMTSSGGSTDVGDLVGNHDSAASVSTQSYGFCTGGSGNNNIERFAFASSASGTDWADLASSLSTNAGAGATNGDGSYGYMICGTQPTALNIQKYPTASQSDATDVGDATQARQSCSGNSSATYGYCAGGSVPPGVNTIDKMAFATDGNSTDVGDLTQATHQLGGSSSLTYGYSVGASGGDEDRIDKFSFATDGNATDVGNLIMDQIGPAGCQI